MNKNVYSPVKGQFGFRNLLQNTFKSQNQLPLGSQDSHRKHLTKYSDLMKQKFQNFNFFRES